MKIPITDYDVTIRDVCEIIIGVLFVIFGILGSGIISNKITGLMLSKSKQIDNRKINIFLLCIHIIIILLFIILIRYLLIKYITNIIVLDSIFSFVGPTIALSSLYFSQNLQILVSLTI